MDLIEEMNEAITRCEVSAPVKYIMSAATATQLLKTESMECGECGNKWGPDGGKIEIECSECGNSSKNILTNTESSVGARPTFEVGYLDN